MLYNSKLTDLSISAAMLALQAIEEGMEGIKRVEQRHISLAEAKAATEVFFISSSMLIMPVVQVCASGRPNWAEHFYSYVDVLPHLPPPDSITAQSLKFPPTLRARPPVVQWDTQLIADGTAGIVALQIRVMLQNDTKPRPASDQHTEVPYGFMTGMEEA